MGFLENRRRRKAERLAQGAAAAQQRAVAAWEAERTELDDQLSTARTFKGATSAEAPEISVALKKGERAVAVLGGCALIESRRAPGHYAGGYSGFSFKIAKGVRYHTGGSRGTYVPGDEQPTAMDVGTVTVTNQRVVFQGSKQAREWSYSKLIGIQHDPQRPWTAIQVSNRQKVSGFFYDDEHTAEVRFRLALGVALFNDATDELAASLERELREHGAARPAPPEIAAQPPAIKPPPPES